MIQLRRYQQDAVTWLCQHPRGILADEVGLGKTFPLIRAAEDYAGKGSRAVLGGPNLVVCPAYLMGQWKEAIQVMLPGTGVRIVNRKDPPIEADDLWAIVSYHTLMNGGVKAHPELLSIRFSVVIFDEAHRLRGRNSQWTKSAYKMRADAMYFATGTPVVKDPGDLFPLLKLCDPREFRSYWRFVDEWCTVLQNPWTKEIHGIKPGLEEKFNQLLDNYLLRRRIEDHLPELPPVIEHRIAVELPPAVQKAHDKAKKEWFLEHEDLDDPVAITSGGALVTKLRQCTAGYIVDDGAVTSVSRENPKIDAIKELLDDHPNEPAIVFCWYTGTGMLLRNAIYESRPTWLVDGHSHPERRAEMVEKWKKQPNGVIVATLASMTEGVNLQHARMVVFSEHDYLPATQEQATARVRRFGQQYPVNVYHIYAKGTVDEVVMRIWQKRGASIKRALLEDLRGFEQPRLLAAA